MKNEEKKKRSLKNEYCLYFSDRPSSDGAPSGSTVPAVHKVSRTI